MSSVSHDPSEIIWICWFAAQETFLTMINVENNCAALCVCVCVCVRVYVVYEDTNLYNNMGMTEVLQFEGGLWGHCLCPRNSKGLKNILNGVFLKI